MERERLEGMSLDEVRQEALRYQLTVATSTDRDKIIGAILEHLMRSSLPEELPLTIQRTAAQKPRSRKGSQTDLPGPSNQTTVPALETPSQVGPMDQFAIMLSAFMDQQKQMLEEIRALSRREASVPSDAPHEREERESEESPRSPAISTSTPAQAVSLLTPQIPEFGGTDDENVQIWTQRVDRVAQVHRAPNDVVLLAASAKLTKLAKRWYEMQQGRVLESWPALKQALLQMFDRRVSFTAAMQRIEARKWNMSKESFDQYAIDKLALIHRLDIPTADSINLIIGGIPQHSLRATALTLPTQSVDKFLEAMRRITFGMSDLEKKNSHLHKGARNKEGHKASDGKTTGQSDSKSTEGTCNYCKKKGHWKADCLALKKKERAADTTSPTAKASSSQQPTTAAVAETEKDKFYLSAPIVFINNINGIENNLSALMDTGSPVSFISLSNFTKIYEEQITSLEKVDRKFNALPKTPINVLGKIK